MNKNTKVIIGILVSVLVLCFCICFGGWVALRISGKLLQEAMVIDNPEETKRIAKELIEYELPEGYQEQSAMNMGFMKMIIISASISDTQLSDRPIFIIASMPSNIEVDEEEMRLQIQLSMKRSTGDQGYDMELVDEQTATIRGQEVTLLIYEGTDDKGIRMRQIISGLFEGENSMIMLFIAGTESGWNQEEIDDFIKSIK